MGLKEGIRYSCYLRVPTKCPSLEEEFDFNIFFSGKVLNIEGNQITLGEFNPVIMGNLISKYPEFSIFVPRSRELFECSYIKTSDEQIICTVKNKITEKRKSFRVLICDSKFFINEKGDIDVLDISYTGISFIPKTRLSINDTVRLKDENRFIDINVLEINEKNGKQIVRGKIVNSNFNLSRFISEKYITFSKKLIKEECNI